MIYIVTTFDQKFYNKSGKKLLESYSKFMENHKKIKFLVYLENVYDPENYNRNDIIFKSIFDDDLLTNWLNENKNLIPKKLGGNYEKKLPIYNHRTSLFFRKIIALQLTLINFKDAEYIIWFDSDLEINKTIDYDFFKNNFNQENIELYYLYGQYRRNYNKNHHNPHYKLGVESGLLVSKKPFNILNEWINIYYKGFTNYKRWDDGWLLCKILEKTKYNSLDIGSDNDNPLEESKYKDYFLHKKGSHQTTFFSNKKLHFVCMVDKEGLKNGTVDNLRRSLNNDLLILDTYDNELKNLSQIFKMKEFLDNDKKIKENDIICLIDANDVIWLPNKKKEDFKKLFLEQNIDLLFGAEIACAKHDHDAKEFFEKKYFNKPFKYLNGGFIIGYRCKYHFMINDIVRKFESEYLKLIKTSRRGPYIQSYSNQRLYSRFILKNDMRHYMNIEIDCDRNFVWNQSPKLSEQDFDIKKVNTFFFHVTFLAGEKQMQIYKKSVDYFLNDEIDLNDYISNKSNNKIFYLLSSITFLQLYLPIVIESSKRGYKNVFLYRKNFKDYADPITRLKEITKICNKYNIKLINCSDISFDKLNGVLFLVDGDIYGSENESFNESLLKKIKYKNIKKISLIEHMNFRWVYFNYIDYIDYCFFPNKYFTDQFDLISTKNKFLGNTKYDCLISKNEIYKKYKLNKKEKYCLILYPKSKFFVHNHIKHKQLNNLYSFLKKLNYKIITKTRPKDNNIPRNRRGVLKISSDKFPNESLELMKISNLCIMFSSSSNDETLYSEIPCINFSIDNVKRNEFINDDKIYKKIDKWEILKFKDFKNIVDNLENKNSEYFKKIKEKYLFNHNNSAKKYIDFIEYEIYKNKLNDK